MSEYMDFGEVLRGLRDGKKFARAGWNGRGMYIYLTDGREIDSKYWEDRTEGQAQTDNERLCGKVCILPHIDMMSATGERVIGWLASQTDMLAYDWVEVE